MNLKKLLAALAVSVLALAVAVPAVAQTPAKPDEPKKDRPINKVPKAVVLTMGEAGDKDMVGQYMTAEAIRRAIPLLEKDNVDIVVFRIKSGGGYTFEVMRLSDCIEFEFKPKFRVVAWIDSAISAASMTAHSIEEIYFTPQGNYGGSTEWSGGLVASKGRGLEDTLFMAEKLSARGKHPKEIMRAMQVSGDTEEFQELKIAPPTGALSATINPDGTVSWFQDATSGQHVLNPKGPVHILTFNAQEAAKFKFSRGTASTLEELTKAMGLTEVEWLGEKKPGYLWPIHAAEKLQMDFREKTHRDSNNIRSYFQTYNMAIAAAQGAQDREERGKFVGKARQNLTLIRNMVRNNPNLSLTVLNMDPNAEFPAWYDEQERRLRELMR